MKRISFTLTLFAIASLSHAQTNMQQSIQNEHWKLEWTSPVEEIKSTAYLFQHKKSGAPLLYLSNEDDNKVFCIAFRTPPTDSTGIAHIMEHSVLCGSERFPSKEPFVDLLKSSLQTFLNAFTADDRTMYPVASRNDKDFTNLMNVYLDAVFFPNVVRTPEILMQEGWHYVVDDTGNLDYNGIVYSEMKGVYSSPTNVLYRTIQKSMYPDSTYSNDSGGNPDNIPDLTQEQFVEFHNKFYHPSNSLIYLYGDGNIEEHLAFLHDEYLHRFDKQDVNVQVIPQPSFAEPKDITAEYSVDPGESTAEKTFLSMNYLLPTDLDNAERSYGMDLLSYILIDSEAGPLRRALLDAELGLDVSVSFDSSILQPCFSIIVHNSDPERKEQFLEVLDTTLKKLVAEGIDRKIIEGAINRTEFILREFQISGFPKGLAINMQVLETWAYGGDPLGHLRFEPVLKNIRAEIENNFFENLIQEYLLNNTSRGFVMLQPKQGLEQENSDRVAAHLADVKKSLSAEQLEKIKRQKEALVERQASPDDPEYVAKIPQLGLSDVDREAENIPFHVIPAQAGIQTSDVNINSLDPRLRGGDGQTMPIVNVDVDTNKIVYITMMFELSPWRQEPAVLSLLADMLGRLDTENYFYADLSSEIDLHTGGISTGLSVSSIYKESDKFNLHFVVRVKTTIPKLEKGLELVYEIMARTKFDDLDRLKEIIQEQRVGMEQSLKSSGHSFARTRSASYFSRKDRYREETGGIEYYKFLVNLEKNFDTKGEMFAQTLQRYSICTFIPEYGQIFVTLPKEDFETVKPVMTNFEVKFPMSYPLPGNPLREKYFSESMVRGSAFGPTDRAEMEREQEMQMAPLECKNEAVIIPSRVQYVVKSADFHRSGFKHSGRMLVLSNILRTGYLWNNIRVQGGAYGSGFAADMNGVFSLWSYRDPQLRRTVDVYGGVSDFLENLELSEEELTKTLIATIGSLDKPLTPSEKGGRVIGMLLSGLTQEDIQRERDEVLSTTVEDLRAFAKMFRDGMEQNNICVFGSEAEINKEKELFKTTIRPIE